MTSFSPLAAYTRSLVLRMTPELEERRLVAILAATAVHVIDRGDVCLPLDGLPDRTVAEVLDAAESLAAAEEKDDDGASGDASADPDLSVRFPSIERIKAALAAATDVVGGGEADGEGRVRTDRPFVLENGRLYTRRNYAYECAVRTAVAGARPADGAAASASAPAPAAAAGDGLEGDQLKAVPVLLGSNFSVLTGGPGTGKTYTLARIVLRALREKPDLRFKLAAPTGKAAARMKQSVREAKEIIRSAGNADEGLLALIPEEALTLHKLLGINPTTGRPWYGRDRRLSLDWLVVDEASMIGLPLVAHLLDALPPGARLTLIGDKDQLASVERGRVFRDLCGMEGRGLPIARLAESHRFKAGGVVDQLARAVNGDGIWEGRTLEDRILEVGRIFSAGGEAEFPLGWRRHGKADEGPARWQGFEDAVKAGYETFARSKTPEEAIEHIEDYRVLCALRHRPPYGMLSVGKWIGGVVRKAWPAAPEPVLVTANDRALGVNNGDLGVVFPDDPDTVWLEADADRTGRPVRRISRWLLPGIETAWATTVHKSQGSEYGSVAIVLPREADAPILTREILYTAITRTKGGIRLWASDAAVRACLERTVARASGLA